MAAYFQVVGTGGPGGSPNLERIASSKWPLWGTPTTSRFLVAEVMAAYAWPFSDTAQSNRCCAGGPPPAIEVADITVGGPFSVR